MLCPVLFNSNTIELTVHTSKNIENVQLQTGTTILGARVAVVRSNRYIYHFDVVYSKIN